jgi:two-component system invasion response regulator UvrY
LTKLVIADDHELIREGIKKIIRRCPDLSVVGEAADLGQALALIAQVRPDLVVLDVTLPDCDGLDGLLVLRRHFPEVKVIMLSMHPEQRYGRAAVRAGAFGYVSKADAASELVHAIRAAASGIAYPVARAEPAVATEAGALARPSQRLLTPREADIVALIGAGLQVKQVAAELGISISSVNTYRTRIFRKMGMSNNAALIRYALQHGLAG